ncbi:mitochondrial amidoxime-reducing component 1-like [Anoplophora glabripennis]|uniref:mitochondrial amidoxime-reducing component 1-like n=1 Tax=Anoplophora glabripennis TaxID=217634 RepID=UPI000873D166|nr:mitochondrial amidoxime-reducing component 1-like [Anoplophora glabripennis]
MGLGGTAMFATLATVVAVVGAYLYQKKKKEIVPWTWEEVGTLKKLHMYPLKSGHRLELTQAECTKVGLTQSKEGDNSYQLKDRSLVVYAEKDHEFRTARTYPKMVLIDVAVHDADHLAIDTPTMRTLYVEIPSKSNSKEVSIKLHANEEIYCIDCGDEAASWFSRYILGKDSGLRLGYHDGSYRRDIRKAHKVDVDYYKNLSNSSTGLYSDLTSILLLNQASVNDLNKRIGNSSVTVLNFRPNFVVDGPDLAPYAEDSWEWVKIGNVVLRNVKECTRCIMTTINPENASRSSDMEPLKTLKKYRLSNGPSKVPIMGIHLEVKRPGSIKVGDPVYVAKSLE